MNSLVIFYIIVVLCSVIINGDNSTAHKYEDETSPGGMVAGSWHIGGDPFSSYECSGVSGATDC